MTAQGTNRNTAYGTAHHRIWQLLAAESGCRWPRRQGLQTRRRVDQEARGDGLAARGREDCKLGDAWIRKLEEMAWLREAETTRASELKKRAGVYRRTRQQRAIARES